MSFKWYGDDAKRRVAREAPRVLRQAAEYVLEEANRTVPLEEGTLQGSGVVDVDETTAVVSYDTPYARRQHEDLTLTHANGRRAKWLERTVMEQGGRVADFIAERLRGALR